MRAQHLALMNQVRRENSEEGGGGDGKDGKESRWMLWCTSLGR